MMRLFRTWTRNEVVEAIRDIESGLATGSQSVSYTGGGTVTYSSRADALRTLQQLYSRLDELDGAKRQPRVRHIRVIPLRGY